MSFLRHFFHDLSRPYKNLSKQCSNNHKHNDLYSIGYIVTRKQSFYWDVSLILIKYEKSKMQISIFIWVLSIWILSIWILSRERSNLFYVAYLRLRIVLPKISWSRSMRFPTSIYWCNPSSIANATSLRCFGSHGTIIACSLLRGGEEGRDERFAFLLTPLLGTIKRD